MHDPSNTPVSDVPPFLPDAVRVFRCTRWSFDPVASEATFEYALDEDIVLQEVFTFAPPSQSLSSARRLAFERVLAHLHLAAGLSYYKLAAPPTVRIECGTWTDDEIAFHRTLLAKGLGEYSWHNDLEAELLPAFEYRAGRPEPAVVGLALDAGALVPVGGGKDSCVTIEALRAARVSVTLVTINRYPVIQDVIDAAALPDLAVRRVLDPQLAVLNANGARNGHVPVTAIVSLAAAAAAILHGHDAVIMSNERSASEGNVLYRGVEINHQWSKSDEAEQLLAGLLASITPELSYFSLLRPLSELDIARRFAQSCSRYLDSFSSCNAAFRLDPLRRVSRWCGRCPKCQFVYLALATVLERSTLVEILGDELFAASPVDGFRALLGLTEWKPFECVGASIECRVALRLLLDEHHGGERRDGWSGHVVLQELAAEVVAAGMWPNVDDVAAVFEATGGFAPPKYVHLLVDA